MSCWDLRWKDLVNLVDHLNKVIPNVEDRLKLPVEWKDSQTLELWIELNDLYQEYGEDLAKHLAKVVELVVKKISERIEVWYGISHIMLKIPLC